MPVVTAFSPYFLPFPLSGPFSPSPTGRAAETKKGKRNFFIAPGGKNSISETRKEQEEEEEEKVKKGGGEIPRIEKEKEKEGADRQTGQPQRPPPPPPPSLLQRDSPREKGARRQNFKKALLQTFFVRSFPLPFSSRGSVFKIPRAPPAQVTFPPPRLSLSFLFKIRRICP